MTRDGPGVDRDAPIARSMTRLVEDPCGRGLAKGPLSRALSLQSLVHPLLLELSLLIQRMLRLLLQGLLDLSLAQPGRRLARLRLFLGSLHPLGLILLGYVVGKQGLLRRSRDLALLLRRVLLGS